MRYDKEQEKERIQLAVKAFFALKGTSLAKVCKDHKLPYHKTWQQMYRAAGLTEDFINDLVQKVDSTATLKKMDTKFIISFKN